MHTRREFLGTLGRVALGAAALGCARGSAFAQGSGSSGIPVGLQLYTVRSLMARDFEGTLAQVAGIGYREVEFAGYFGHTPAQVRAALARYGLTSPSTHIALPADDEAWKRTLGEANAIGHEWVTIAWLDAPLRRTPADWVRIADRFNHLGALARRAGLRFAYHNHDFEFAGVRGGQTGYDVLLAETDPDLVDFELDIYWATFAGRDAVEIFNRAPGRFKLWHVKDLAGTGTERGMAPVGKGQIDWKRIFDNAELAGLHYPFVEHDSAASYPGGSVESIRISHDYLEQLLA